MNEAVAAIVPAYNESATVGSVVRTLVASGCFRDVIVVSDGSTDRTAEEARAAGATLVSELPRNIGKGAALIHGVAQTDAPILFLCDADLLDLRGEHIHRILQPVLEGRLTMNVGIYDHGETLSKIVEHLPLLGGQRALRRTVFDAVAEKYLQGYMIESALNYACRARGLKYGSIVLTGMKVRRKIEKVGLLRGLLGYVIMCWQVAYAMVAVRFAWLFGQF